MSDFQTAVNWLNHFDRSNMNDATRFLVNRFQQASLDEYDADQQANVVEVAAEASRNPAASGEALILIAEKRFQAGRYKLAWAGLKKAVMIYEKEEAQKNTSAVLHRLWVARWLCGWAAWKLHLNYTANMTWRYARENIEKLIQNSVDERNSDREKWYQERQREMDVEFACRAEEAITWIYNFPAQNVRVRKPVGKRKVDRLYDVDDVESEMNITGISRMSEDLVKQRNRIITEIKRAEDVQSKLEGEKVGDFRVPGQIVQDVLEAVEKRADMEERAEAWLECGLAFHQMGDHGEAVNYVARAVSIYPPGSHQKAVARWMQGIMQTHVQAVNWRAFESFQRALDEMSELRQRANIANNKPLVDWYTKKIATLTDAMELMRGRIHADR